MIIKMILEMNDFEIVLISASIKSDDNIILTISRFSFSIAK